MSKIKIIEPGFFSTIQDHGRIGFRHKGVPLSGPMDTKGFEFAHKLVGNDYQKSLIEATLKGPTLLIEGKTTLAYSGAPMDVYLNKDKMLINKTFECNLGDIVRFGNCLSGVRTYISFRGGLKVSSVLGSSSYYYPVTNKKILEKGNEFCIDSKSENINYDLNDITEDYYFKDNLNVSKGPDWDTISSDIKEHLLKNYFTIGINDRMGYHLEGDDKLKNRIHLESSAVFPGTVQLTPKGILLVSMADGQVTGGYPRVLILDKSSIAVLAQKRRGEKIKFESNHLRK